MSSKVPIVKQIAWVSLIPQLLIMALIILLWWLFYPDAALFFSGLTYLILAFFLRGLVPKSQRAGMKKLKSGDFNGAILDFEKSYDFFNKNHWIDRYRCLTLFSASQISYREMALVNIAFCYGQLGDGGKCKAYYERTLKEFPNSSIAQVSLKMLSSMEKNPGA